MTIIMNGYAPPSQSFPPISTRFRVTSISSHREIREYTETHISGTFTRTTRPFKVVEDCTVMGQLHELLAKPSAKELETALEINEPPKEELDHAEAYRSSEQEEQAKEDASEKDSPRKGKANHSQDAADRPDPREREPDDEEEHIPGTVPTTPHGRTKGPQTRWRALMDNVVIPEPITDIPSDLEATQTKPKRSISAWMQVDRTPLDGPAGACGELRCEAETPVSTQRTGYADDTDCYLRLDHLAGCLDSDPIHQRF
jgi:hypothetical protein